jgi:isoleucyl-tRNA synthetase
LEEWPEQKEELINQEILNDMMRIREVVSKALDLRSKAVIKVRQPLASLKIKSFTPPGGARISKIKNNEDLLKLIKEEVNVKEIIFDENIENDIELDTVITEELKQEGMLRDLVRLIQGHRKQLGLNPGQKVDILICADENGRKFVEKNLSFLKKETSIDDFQFVKEKGDNVLLYISN